MNVSIKMLEILFAFIGAEMPLFALVLHMNARIVKLETTIELLVTRIPKRRNEIERDQ